MDFGPIEGIFEGAKRINLYIDGQGMANWAIFYLAHKEHVIRVHLSHFGPSTDVWFGQNKYFIL